MVVRHFVLLCHLSNKYLYWLIYTFGLIIAKMLDESWINMPAIY